MGAAQGKEFDIGVLDLVIGRMFGAMANAERIKVMLTRVRYGLVVVADVDEIHTGLVRGLDSMWPHTAQN